MFDAGERLLSSRDAFEVGRTSRTCSCASFGTIIEPMLPPAAVMRIVGVEDMVSRFAVRYLLSKIFSITLILSSHEETDLNDHG